MERSVHTVASIPVTDIFSARIVDFNNDKYMLEVGANVFRCEGQGSWFLKHNGDDVISDVSLSEQLEVEQRGEERCKCLKVLHNKGCTWFSNYNMMC